MHKNGRFSLAVLNLAVFFLISLLNRSSQAQEANPSLIATVPQISGIRIAGSPVIVFDHLKDKHEWDQLPDAPVTAWKNADGTVNLTIPFYEEFRMRGPDLLHLKSDPNKIYSSMTQASDPVENHYNYFHWFLAPYTVDGNNIYALTHTEWYACVLVGDCNQGNNQIDSWATTNNSLKSSDGGATWSANGLNQAHLVIDGGDHWTGSPELKQRVYRKAFDHSGMFTPSRLIQEGAYYYSIGFQVHRDFSKLDASTGLAPVDRYGYVLIRTKDITNPKGWEAWVGGTKFHTFTQHDYANFQAQQNGVALNGSQVQLIYDQHAQEYVVVFVIWGANGPVYYMTTKSLAAPAWSDASVVAGSAKLQADPRGPSNKACNKGFGAANYISILDPHSPGMNFEFTTGTPWLFYVVNPALCGGDNLQRDIYRVKLAVSYR